MKINPGPGIKQLENIQKKPNVQSAEKTGKSKGSDKVDFSKELQNIQESKSAMSVDKNRQARLESVKEQIDNGTYAPDSKKVAVSLLKYIAKEKVNE